MAPSLSEPVSSCVAVALRGSNFPPLRKLKVDETDQEIVLSGKVSSYYHKQLAQEAVMPFLEGRILVNQVQVVNR